jgi:hypothetical protein
MFNSRNSSWKSKRVKIENQKFVLILFHLLLKVFIHNPHQKYNISNGGRSDNQALLDSNLSLLNINAVVTALATGILDSASKNEYLLVGTKTNVLAYDVDNNVDLFHKDVKFIY